jgi:nucleoside-diphosphate-sugar epimerase
VYGAPRSNPVTEEAAFNPRVPYDFSKVAGEAFVMGYHRAKGLPVSITRAWLLFGEYDAPTRAVPRFIASCLRNEPIRLFNSGRDTTAPSHAENYGRLVAGLIEKDAAVGQAFNFAGEKTITIRELADLVRSLTGSKSELQMLPPRSESEKEPQVSYPSTDKMKRLLGYEYELDLEAGLRRTADWLRSSL